MAQDRAVKGEGLYRGVAGERNTRSVALLGRIDVFSRRQHSRERSQRQIELLGAGGAERQADGVGSMAGDHGEGGRRGQGDVAPGRGRDESLRAPMLGQSEPEM